MKKTFRITVIIKDAKIEFKEGMGIGVVASKDIEFTLPKGYDKTTLAISLLKHEEEFLHDICKAITQEVKK